MGVMNHNAIVATTWDDDKFYIVKQWITDLGGDYAQFRCLFAFSGSVANGYQTIVLCPDGSKEGWKPSVQGNELRDRFVARLEQDCYGDGSSPWCWVEIGFGEFGQKIIRGNNKNRYNDKLYAED